MAESANTAPKSEEVVRALVVPLADTNLLVPNTAIAEVVAYSEPQPLPDAPTWVLGMLRWRGLTIPLVSFERFTGAEKSAPDPKRIVILNTLNGNKRLPFVAVASQAIPRSMRFSRSLVQKTDDSATDGVSLGLETKELDLAIPDLDAIEAALSQRGLTVVEGDG